MTQKAYDSLEYLAQTFKAFLKGEKDKSIFKKFGFALPNAKRNGNIVSFKYRKIITNYITFEKRGDKDYVCLEMKLINEGGIERDKTLGKKLDNTKID